jgi:hypothetical protein
MLHFPFSMLIGISNFVGHGVSPRSSHIGSTTVNEPDSTTRPPVGRIRGRKSPVQVEERLAFERRCLGRNEKCNTQGKDNHPGVAWGKYIGHTDSLLTDRDLLLSWTGGCTKSVSLQTLNSSPLSALPLRVLRSVAAVCILDSFTRKYGYFGPPL